LFVARCGRSSWRKYFFHIIAVVTVFIVVFRFPIVSFHFELRFHDEDGSGQSRRSRATSGRHADVPYFAGDTGAGRGTDRVWKTM
jgi:hypothetical protein